MGQDSMKSLIGRSVANAERMKVSVPLLDVLDLLQIARGHEAVLAESTANNYGAYRKHSSDATVRLLHRLARIFTEPLTEEQRNSDGLALVVESRSQVLTEYGENIKNSAVAEEASQLAFLIETTVIGGINYKVENIRLEHRMAWRWLNAAYELAKQAHDQSDTREQFFEQLKQGMNEFIGKNRNDCVERMDALARDHAAHSDSVSGIALFYKHARSSTDDVEGISWEEELLDKRNDGNG